MTDLQHFPLMSLCSRLVARTTQLVLGATALAAMAATGLATLGVLPWPLLPVSFEGGTTIEAGAGVQIGMAVFLVALCGFLPASHRVLQLELSHRRFRAGMDDVARAYYAAHAADRRGVFRFVNEFDAVRERFAFLRSHPDLSALEPEVLELAAQMSHVGRDLARIYSDDKVAAARELLTNRGDQAARIEADVIRATRIIAELVARLAEVEDQEEHATGRIARLRTELDALLPRLGLVTKPAEQVGSEAASGSTVEPAKCDDNFPSPPAMALVRG